MKDVHESTINRLHVSSNNAATTKDKNNDSRICDAIVDSVTSSKAKDSSKLTEDLQPVQQYVLDKCCHGCDKDTTKKCKNDVSDGC